MRTMNNAVNLPLLGLAVVGFPQQVYCSPRKFKPTPFKAEYLPSSVDCPLARSNADAV